MLYNELPYVSLEFSTDFKDFFNFLFLLHNFLTLCGMYIYKTGDSDPPLQTSLNLALPVTTEVKLFSGLLFWVQYYTPVNLYFSNLQACSDVWYFPQF